jgi:hypothetical protein
VVPGRKRDSTSEEIDGSDEKLKPEQSKADLRVPGLHHYSWRYIQSATLEELETNRAKLVSLLRSQDRRYISVHWRGHEEQVILLHRSIR